MEEAQAPQLIKPYRFRVRVPNPILLSLLLSIILNAPPISSSPLISYHDHCNSVVPEPNLTSEEIYSYDFLFPYNSYYQGGDPILSQPSQNPQIYSSLFPRSLRYRTNRLAKTTQTGVLQVEGTLVFRTTGLFSSLIGNYSFGEVKRSRFRTRKPRFASRRGRTAFELKGFWSGLDGKLCMVGSAIGYSKGGNLLDLSAVFRANYVNTSNLLSSLVTGSLESLDSADKESYFSPVSMMAFSQRNYNYSLIESVRKSGGCDRLNGGNGDDDDDDDEGGLSIGNGGSGGGNGTSVCSAFYEMLYGELELEYKNGSQCDSSTKDCKSPLGEKFFGGKPGFMSFGGVQCSETDNPKIRLLMGFSNSSGNVMGGYYSPMDPNTTMVGEGVWDGEKNRVCIVACHVLNYEKSLLDAIVGDCSVRMRLRFPSVLSIKSRSSVVGQIWSNKTAKESDHFGGIKFRSSVERNAGAPGLNYQYTELERVNKLCPKKAVVGIQRKVYPDVYSFDMRFDMNVKNSKGERTWGYFAPLSIGDEFFDQLVHFVGVAMAPQSSVVYRRQNYSTVMNVSYAISFSNPVHFNFDGRDSSTNSTSTFKIRAEGVYDSGSGSLCMIGCRDLASNLKGSKQNESLDCEILINAQFPALHAKKKANVEGTIESTRKKSDLLHFERLEFSAIAMSTTEAVESIWRMDLEITMVLISNTLLCIFVCLQLFYVKKHPDVLPSISLLMLVILTLGSMIPLVLNFEALFLSNRTRQNVLSGGGGWLEVNEVIVRVVTMVAFLLQVRLLQLTWSSRTGEGNSKGIWTAEKKALYVLLPLYLLGGLIAWFVLRWDNYSELTDLSNGSVGVVALDENHSLLGDLRSYAGLLLDGFLLPQILLNIFFCSKDKILSHAFYLGVTAVRLLPHAYDLYRANSYSAYYNAAYFYANPHGDYFSTAWDVIILCGGSILAVLVFVQQRLGGRCILPRSYRDFDLYEKVPVSTGE